MPKKETAKKAPETKDPKSNGNNKQDSKASKTQAKIKAQMAKSKAKEYRVLKPTDGQVKVEFIRNGFQTVMNKNVADKLEAKGEIKRLK